MTTTGSVKSARFGMVTAACVVAGSLGWSFIKARIDAGGKLEEVFWLGSVAPAKLLARDRADSKRGWSLLSLADGKVLARVFEHGDSRGAFVGATRDYLWFSRRRRIYARSVNNLQMALDHEQLLARIRRGKPYLEGCKRPVFSRARRELHVTARDGRGFLIDPHTFAATRSPRDEIRRNYPRGAKGLRTARSARLEDHSTVRMRGQIRRRLASSGSRGLPAEQSGERGEPDALIRGELVRSGVGRKVISFGTPASVLVLHFADISPKAAPLLSRVTIAGRKRWTVRLDQLGGASRKPIAAYRHERQLVVLFPGDKPSKFLLSRGTKNTIAAIALDDGHVLWRRKF